MWWTYCIWAVINHLHTSHPLPFLTLLRLFLHSLWAFAGEWCFARSVRLLRSDPGTARCDPDPACTGVITKDTAKEAQSACPEQERPGLRFSFQTFFWNCFKWSEWVFLKSLWCCILNSYLMTKVIAFKSHVLQIMAGSPGIICYKMHHPSQLHQNQIGGLSSFEILTFNKCTHEEHLCHFWIFHQLSRFDQVQANGVWNNPRYHFWQAAG